MLIAEEQKRKVMLESISVVKGETVHEQVYQELRRNLMNGQLKPGQALSIRYLCEQLNVSATPAREAIKRLQAERALIVGANRAPTVPIPSRIDLRDLRDIRMSLEGLATEKAVSRIKADEIKALETYCQNMFDSIAADDFDAYLENNWAFHRIIYRAAQSELMMDIIETLWMRSGPLVRLALNGNEHMSHSMANHTRALDAVKRRDPVVARIAIEADISGAAADLEKSLPK